jgi:hypothetical protein
MSSDYILLTFTYYRIAFLVTDSGILSDNSKALLNAEEVNPFVADLDSLFFIKTTGNFFGTPVLLD